MCGIEEDTMPIPIRELTPSLDDRYQILTTDDGSRTLVEIQSNDSFHSGCGALTETKHVYLANSGVLERIQTQCASAVLEVGVGTAMGLLCTLDAALAYDAPLDYVGLETRWITAELLNQLAPQSWVENTSLATRYLEWRSNFPREAIDGDYVWQIDANKKATIRVGNAIDWVPSNDDRFDAIYFDPFAPASATELWAKPMLSKMRNVMKPDGLFVTYCVNRQVRDDLLEAGFQVTRVAGPVGGKREVLLASIG